MYPIQIKVLVDAQFAVAHDDAVRPRSDMIKLDLVMLVRKRITGNAAIVECLSSTSSTDVLCGAEIWGTLQARAMLSDIKFMPNAQLSFR